MACSSSTTGRSTRQTDTSGTVNLTAGICYPITVEYFDVSGQGWRGSMADSGTGSYVAVPADRLFAN
jgi:hypothetical protein